MVKKSGNKVEKKVNLQAATSYYAQIISAGGLCLFGPDTVDFPMVEYLNAVTGWDLPADEYFYTGKRILNLRKAFNVREGIKALDSKMPSRALGQPPQTKGPLKGKSVDMETLEQHYYEVIGCDPTTGGPTPETMKALDLDSLFA